jgi:hypothetical protein
MGALASIDDGHQARAAGVELRDEVRALLALEVGPIRRVRLMVPIRLLRQDRAGRGEGDGSRRGQCNGSKIHDVPFQALTGARRPASAPDPRDHARSGLARKGPAPHAKVALGGARADV